MTYSMNFLQLIEDGDVTSIKRLLETYPESVHRHIALERPWGEELWLPLHLAAREGNQQVMDMILDAGGNIDGRTRFIESPLKARATALHIATSERKCEAVRLLLQRGADVFARKADGALPGEIAQALVDAGHEDAQAILSLIRGYESKNE